LLQHPSGQGLTDLLGIEVAEDVGLDEGGGGVLEENLLIVRGVIWGAMNARILLFTQTFQYTR